MFIDPAIFFAALGITTLELAEASAVGIALYAESRRISALLAVAAGVIIVMIPTALAGSFISIFPLVYVRLFSATLLLYFGLRLMKSARRSFRYQREGFRPKGEEARENGDEASCKSSRYHYYDDPGSDCKQCRYAPENRVD